jgi:flavin-dependent thymidylate synthase
MKILKNAGTFEILVTWPSKETNENAQMILEKAGRTCYQSEKHKITPQSAQKFVSNCCKRTHYSVIEHGWRGYIITPIPEHDVLFSWWPQIKYAYITKRKNQLLISANLETWRKLYKSHKLNFVIRTDLETFAPSIFTDVKQTMMLSMSHMQENFIPITSIEQLQTDDEKLTHIAHTVQYNNHSRGFTHELVRHRLPVYSQESTRYVDESNFEVIVPPHKNENEQIIKDVCMQTIKDECLCQCYKDAKNISLINFFDLNKKAYQDLRKSGWRPEDARQILPTAIKAQIVMSCNIKTRRYIYYRRTSEFAHWEIRKTMCNELKEFSSLYPNLFNMFQYINKCAKDNIDGYYITNCSSEIFLND